MATDPPMADRSSRHSQTTPIPVEQWTVIIGYQYYGGDD